MVNFDYLYRGLCGLARAHRVNSLTGHLGAALVAGYFFGEECSDLDSVVYTAVEKELDRIIAGEESIWFNARTAPLTVAELFEPLPDEQADKKSINAITAAHRHHLRLFQSLPNMEEEFGPVKSSQHDPRTPQFWTAGPLKRDSARLTHRIKTLYGFFTLSRYVSDPARRKQAEEQFLHLMA